MNRGNWSKPGDGQPMAGMDLCGIARPDGMLGLRPRPPLRYGPLPQTAASNREAR